MSNKSADSIRNLLENIKNPYSGKTLGDESRIKNVMGSGEEIHIKYDRDGLALQEKRTVEDLIYNTLSDVFENDQINIMSLSKDSKPVAPKAPAGPQQTQPASLQAGHGSIGNKKRIPNVNNIIAVSSNKGGVGKSTVTMNLALTLRNLGHKVGILDADIYGPSLPMLINQREAKPLAEDSRIKPIDALDMKFISFGLFINEDDPVVWRGPMLNGVLNQFLFDVDWGTLDYLLIDMPPGTGDVQLSLSQNTELDGALVVSTPQQIAILDTQKGLQMWKKMEVPVLGMIENMSAFICDSCDKEHHIFGKDGVKNAADSLGVKFLGGVPLEVSMREGSDEGKPYMDNKENEGRPAWNAYMSIAKSL